MHLRPFIHKETEKNHRGASTAVSKELLPLYGRLKILHRFALFCFALHRVCRVQAIRERRDERRETRILPGSKKKKGTPRKKETISLSALFLDLSLILLLLLLLHTGGKRGYLLILQFLQALVLSSHDPPQRHTLSLTHSLSLFLRP